jgi:hypothetical protein
MKIRCNGVLLKQFITVLEIVFIICFSVFYSCSNSVAGNSSQTGNNGVTVTASCGSISGETKPEIHVSIYEQKFIPYITPSRFSDSTKTDDSGKFLFSSLAQGYYNLLIQDTGSDEAAFVRNIPVFADSVHTDTSKLLLVSGYFKGQFNENVDWKSESFVVYLEGSPFNSQIDYNGEFMIGPVPSGNYIFGYTDKYSDANPVPPFNDLPIESGKVFGNITVYSDSTVQWYQN